MQIKHNGIEFTITDDKKKQQIVSILLDESTVRSVGRPVGSRTYRKHKHSRYSDEETKAIIELYNTGARVSTIANRVKRNPIAVAAKIQNLADKSLLVRRHKRNAEIRRQIEQQAI